jgi:hypothetical protein
VERGDGITGEPVAGGETKKTVAVETVESVLSTDPKEALAILREGGNYTIAQTLVCAVELKDVVSAV